MFKLNQKGVAHLLVPIILLLGLVVGVYLIGKETNILPKAFSPKSLSGPIGSPTPTPTPFTCTACAADIVKDARNQVNASDYAILSTCFNQPLSKTLSGDRTCAVADINKDGSVNQDDYTCLKSVYSQRCTASPTPTPTPQPSSCALGAHIKFSDIVADGPMEKFVRLSLRQPTTGVEQWKFNSVPARNNTGPFYRKDIYTFGVGNVQCGTYDLYISSDGYQEKKYPNVVVDNNSNYDPELYVLYGPLVRSFTCNACAADINKNGRVEARDYGIFASCFGAAASDVRFGLSCTQADIDGSGKVDQADLTCLQSKYGQRCTAKPKP